MDEHIPHFMLAKVQSEHRGLLFDIITDQVCKAVDIR